MNSAFFICSGVPLNSSIFSTSGFTIYLSFIVISSHSCWPLINLQSFILIPKRCSLICSPTKYPASKDSFKCPYTGIPFEINVSTMVSTAISFPTDAITSAQTSGSEQCSATIAPIS